MRRIESVPNPKPAPWAKVLECGHEIARFRDWRDAEAWALAQRGHGRLGLEIEDVFE